MKRIYTTILTAMCLLFFWQAQAQRIVNIPSDPLDVVDMYDVIMGDTTATGERVDNNTIYTLDNGGLYISSVRLGNTKEWPLQIQAVDLTDLDNKPIITRIPNSTGGYPQIAWVDGDMSLTNLWIISGEKGPLEGHDWGQIRMLGDSTTIRVTDCIIEKDRGGFLQLRANMVKCFVDNCIFRNGGNRFILEGNGRGIDARNFVFDTLIVKNSIIHNIVDRVFRSQGGTAAHNYIAFDNNTIFNVAGRHGCFQLRWVNSARITNNIMINPMMLGTTPRLTDEQNQPDDEAHKIITLDTVTSATQLFIANNNIYWTPDVEAAWVPHADSVKKPAILSMLVKQVMGADTANAYFEDMITLNNVPQNITQYIIDLYANPAATDMFDFVVEDSAVFMSPTDNGNLFNFAAFDPCYPGTSVSATSATHGGAIGYTLGCEGLNIPSEYGTAIEDPNEGLGLVAAPNPFHSVTDLSFFLPKAGYASLTVYDVSGKVVDVVADGPMHAGQHLVTWSPGSSLSRGLYFLRLQSEQGYMVQKLLVD